MMNRSQSVVNMGLALLCAANYDNVDSNGATLSLSSQEL